MRIPSRPIHYFTEDLSHQGRVKYENRTAKVRAGLVAIIVLGSVIDIRVQSLKSRLMLAHNQTTTQISFSTRTFLNNKSYRKDEKLTKRVKSMEITPLSSTQPAINILGNKVLN